MSGLIPLLAPFVLILAALVAFTGPGFRPRLTLRLAEGAALLAAIVAVASAVLLVQGGAQTAPEIGWGAWALAARLDAVSAVMLLLVAFVGWVVLRFAATYLDGEARQGPFTGWMALTLASVMLLVMAGTLVQLVGAWVATSLALHKLLLFYPERVAAQRAARKKWVTARAGDLALVSAAVLLAWGYGTGDIASILGAAKEGAAPVQALWATGFLALAALLKSAQFPLHGWLTEVMEAPTPVSALLHAGVVNAGGFLLIRFADVMLLAPGVLAVLVMAGGFTAIFGGLVMLTQSAVKTSLAWSTVGQMGFMILQCGLGLWPLALLHIVAHSLYKAHAFLSSGGAVEVVAQIRRPGPVAVPDGRAVARAFLAALGIYAAVGQMGFMILQCGLGLWSLALLHIVAHSLYKAHAFLSSGGAVEVVAQIRRPGPVAVPDGRAVTRAFLAALGIYAAVGLLFGIADKSPQAVALGAILIFGVAYLIAQGLADAAPAALTRKTAVASVATAVGYFGLQRGAEWVAAGTLPATPPPGPLEWALMVLAVLTFGLVAWAQATFPIWSAHPAAAGLRVHLSNGLYANAVLDRLLGGYRLARTTTPAE